MNAKWYLSTLIIILTLLGVSHQQISIPNQEIVLEFVDKDVTSNEIQDAIAIVKKQLQVLGVDNIQVRKDADGTLKITYYSHVNVASIKKILSNEKNIELGYASYPQDKEHTKRPSDENSNGYNLDVYEIHKSTNAELGLDGKYVLELKHEYDRFSNPNVYVFIHDIDISQRDRLVKVAYKVRRNIAIAINNIPHKIPEVRAGPIALLG